MVENLIESKSFEAYAKRIVDAINNGDKPHGGNLAYLAYDAPELAKPIHDMIAERAEQPPKTIEEFADLLEFNSEEDKQSYIAQNSKKN